MGIDIDCIIGYTTMRPSDFILNSDYLTLAQTSTTKPIVLYFPPRTFPTSSQTMQPFSVTQEITSPAVPGAVDRICITYNGTQYIAGQVYRPPDITVTSGNLYQDQYWVLNVYRKDSRTLVARCDFVPPTSAQTVPDTPSLTFTISATSFRPPNVL